MDKPLNEMTIADVVETKTFQRLLSNELAEYKKEIRIARAKSEYGLKRTELIRLEQGGLLVTGKFIPLYCECLDKKCSLPAEERNVIVAIGNDVFRKAMIQLQEDEAERNNADGTDK